MDYLTAALAQAIRWLLGGHAEVYGIVWVTVKIVTVATLIASVIGVPLGVSLAVSQFRGKRLVASIFNTLLSMPTVVVGLTVYAFLSRQGPLGELGLLFTPWAVIIGDVLLGLPILVAFTLAAVQGVDPRVRETALTLGAGAARAALAVLSEARLAVCGAVVAAFGRIIA
ncbi:MAG: ABC transporter permease, partial [Candidatus Tectomicrobia bacterium]|nr:ABC transporter permease [Candidatus Tectomicrobia bacterium]